MIVQLLAILGGGYVAKRVYDSSEGVQDAVSGVKRMTMEAVDKAASVIGKGADAMASELDDDDDDDDDK